MFVGHCTIYRENIFNNALLVISILELPVWFVNTLNLEIAI